MYKLVSFAIIGLLICFVVSFFEDIAAAEPETPVVVVTEQQSVVEQHMATPKAKKELFPKQENRAELKSTSDPKTIRVIQLDSLGREAPNRQQFVIKDGNVYYADFAGRPDYSKPAGKLKD